MAIERWWWELPSLCSEAHSVWGRLSRVDRHVHMHHNTMHTCEPVSRETWACSSIGASDNESLEFTARKSPSDWRAPRSLRFESPAAKTLSINSNHISPGTLGVMKNWNILESRHLAFNVQGQCRNGMQASGCVSATDSALRISKVRSSLQPWHLRAWFINCSVVRPIPGIPQFTMKTTKENSTILGFNEFFCAVVLRHCHGSLIPKFPSSIHGVKKSRWSAARARRNRAMLAPVTLGPSRGTDPACTHSPLPLMSP